MVLQARHLSSERNFIYFFISFLVNQNPGEPVCDGINRLMCIFLHKIESNIVISLKNVASVRLWWVYSYDMSAGRCDSSPDSRSMPTVDLQWWLSSTDVFCTKQGNIQNVFFKQFHYYAANTGWSWVLICPISLKCIFFQIVPQHSKREKCCREKDGFYFCRYPTLSPECFSSV